MIYRQFTGVFFKVLSLQTLPDIINEMFTGWTATLLPVPAGALGLSPQTDIRILSSIATGQPLEPKLHQNYVQILKPIQL